MKFIEALKCLITKDKNSEEYQAAFNEFKNAKISYGLYKYFRDCLGNAPFAMQLTEDRLTMLVNFLREKLTIFTAVEDAVLVAGGPGAGKSTLINYLSQVELEKSGDNGLFVAVKNDSRVSPVVPIFPGYKCHALYPLLLRTQGGTFVEIPNIDNGDYDVEALEISDLLTQLMLDKLKSIKAVMVVIDEALTQKGHYFMASTENYLKKLHDLFEINPGGVGLPFLYVISKANRNLPANSYFNANEFQSEIVRRFERNANSLRIPKEQIFICRPIKLQQRDSLDHKVDMLLTLHNPAYMQMRGRASQGFFVDPLPQQIQGQDVNPVPENNHKCCSIQ